MNSLDVNTNEIDSKDIWKCEYHLAPEKGWIGGTAGMCYFNWYYHIYYQYCDDKSGEGVHYLRHYKSKNLRNWEEVGEALRADSEWDTKGILSGSSIIYNDDLHMFYTGISEDRTHNIVHAKSKDGDNFEKIGKVNIEIPQGVGRVREPKVWRHVNEFYMIIMCDMEDKSTKIALYSSKHLDTWTFENIIVEDLDDNYIWEKPDIFKLNRRDVLLLSSKNKEKSDVDIDAYNTTYFVGDIDYQKKTFEHTKGDILDSGFDYYGVQTFEDRYGKRISWPWLGVPDIDEKEYENPTIEVQHVLGIPRELRFKENKIIQKSLEEMRDIRDDHFHKNIFIEGDLELEELQEEKYEFCIGFSSVEEFNMTLRDDIKVKYNWEDEMFRLKLGKSGYGRDSREFKIGRLEDIRVFSDASTLELFINGGEEVLATRVYPTKGSNKVKFGGKAYGRLDKWSINLEE